MWTPQTASESANKVTVIFAGDLHEFWIAKSSTFGDLARRVEVIAQQEYKAPSLVTIRLGGPARRTKSNDIWSRLLPKAWALIDR